MPPQTTHASWPAVASTRGSSTDFRALFGTPSIKTRVAADPKAPRASRASIRGRAIGSSKVFKVHKKAVHARQGQYVRLRARLVSCSPSEDKTGGKDIRVVQDFNLPYEAPMSSERMRELLDSSEDLEMGDPGVCNPSQQDGSIDSLLDKLHATAIVDDDVAASVEASAQKEIWRSPFNLSDLMGSLEAIKVKATDITGDEEEAFRERLIALVARSEQQVAVQQLLGPDAGTIEGAVARMSGQGSRPSKRRAPALRGSQAPAPITDNDFYRPGLTLERSAELLLVKLEEAKGNCQRWTDVYTADRFRALARDKRKTVLKVCDALYHIAQFLHRGRHGWQLMQWSTAVFAKVDSLLPEVVRCLTRLAAYPGCSWLKNQGLVHALEVRKRLTAIQGEKIEMEEWRQAAADAELERALQQALEA
ncbi:hypothetical protein LTR85_002553 [Meristemomyces frigidus]|nr:hypothetical protein LTR85_002553 [Meristemomyces frigidus]